MADVSWPVGTLLVLVVTNLLFQLRQYVRVERAIALLKMLSDESDEVEHSHLLTDGGFPAEEEPDGAALAPHHFYVGIAVAVFGFASVWPWYSWTGAAMVLVGLAIAADDALSHAFGIPTPLDLIWKKAIHPNLPRRGGG